MAFNKLNEAMGISGEESTKDLYPEKDECPNPDCHYCSMDGECIFETCQIEELPKVDESYKFKCIMCDEEQEANPMSVQGRARLCDDCLEKILETHQIKENYTCIICGKSTMDKRQIFGVNMCIECFNKLKSRILYW